MVAFGSSLDVAAIQQVRLMALDAAAAAAGAAGCNSNARAILLQLVPCVVANEQVGMNVQVLPAAVAVELLVACSASRCTPLD